MIKYGRYGELRERISIVGTNQDPSKLAKKTDPYALITLNPSENLIVLLNEAGVVHTQRGGLIYLTDPRLLNPSTTPRTWESMEPPAPVPHIELRVNQTLEA